MSSIVLHAWTLHKKDSKYYLPYTHWVYLNEITKYYDDICLLSPVNLVFTDDSKFESIEVFSNVSVYELPYSTGYIDAIKYFFKYVKGYSILSKKYNKVYARYPIPFGWLQMFYFKRKERIIHFVGDPIDTIINNPNFSSVKKILYRVFFTPEELMFNYACKKAIVYTNGFHIAEKLKNRNVFSIPVISSTLSEKDFFIDDKEIDKDAPKVVYVGYLRKAKGVDVVLKAFSRLVNEKPKSQLTIVGTGELETSLREIVISNNIKNVSFTGHIDSRDRLNVLLRENNIFCFASVSEGSPRVVLEAMANGLVVLSTPVGSLPTTFKNEEEILFADFNDSEDFYSKMMKLSDDDNLYKELRKNGHNKVKEFTIDEFIKTIFYYE